MFFEGDVRLWMMTRRRGFRRHDEDGYLIHHVLQVSHRKLLRCSFKSHGNMANLVFKEQIEKYSSSKDGRYNIRVSSHETLRSIHLTS